MKNPKIKYILYIAFMLYKVQDEIKKRKSYLK